MWSKFFKQENMIKLIAFTLVILVIWLVKSNQQRQRRIHEIQMVERVLDAQYRQTYRQRL
jgi:uncharacterized protein YoxC